MIKQETNRCRQDGMDAGDKQRTDAGETHYMERKYVGSKTNERRHQQRRGKTYAEKTGNINKQGTNICRVNNINDQEFYQYMQRREPAF